MLDAAGTDGKVCDKVTFAASYSRGADAARDSNRKPELERHQSGGGRDGRSRPIANS